MIQLRWVALLIQFVFVLIALSIDLIAYQQFVKSIVVLIPLFIFNQLFTNSSYKNRFAFMQLSLDLLAAFLLLFINGGLRNPFSPILVIPLFLSPFFLSRKESLVFFPIPLCLLYLLQFSPYELLYENIIGNYLPTFSLLTIALTMWFLAHWLVKELDKLNNEVQNLTLYSQRIDKFRSLGLLTGGVCHELGTPLNTAIMRLERKEDVEEPIFDKKDFDIILKNLQKCSEALKSLNTSIHNLNEGSHEEKVDLIFSLDQAIRDFKDDQRGDQNVEFFLKLPSSFKIKIKLPQLVIYRSFMDLFENARDAKATRIEIKIYEERKTQLVKIEICDNGNGFSKEVLNNIGGPFVTTKETGSGLGLYQIINSFSYIGGSLDFDSLSGKTKVTITLPAEVKL